LVEAGWNNRLEGAPVRVEMKNAFGSSDESTWFDLPDEG